MHALQISSIRFLHSVFKVRGTRCPSLFCWVTFFDFSHQGSQTVNLFCPGPLVIDWKKRKSTVQNEPRGYGYPVSIRFRTVLGGFSVFADPAPLARLEINAIWLSSCCPVPRDRSRLRLLRYLEYKGNRQIAQRSLSLISPNYSPE